MSEQTLTVKRFGLSAADLRAKREAKRQARANDLLLREAEAAEQRVTHMLICRTDWPLLQVWSVHSEQVHEAERIKAALWRERWERQTVVEFCCWDIWKQHQPLIQAARLVHGGTAEKRRIKREIKEQKRQARWMGE